MSVLRYRGGVIGFAKIARKKLVLFDVKGGKKQYEPVCILDFFIDPAYQRQGNGSKLLNYVLQVRRTENVFPCAVAAYYRNWKMTRHRSNVPLKIAKSQNHNSGKWLTPGNMD